MNLLVHSVGSNIYIYIYIFIYKKKKKKKNQIYIYINQCFIILSFIIKDKTWLLFIINKYFEYRSNIK